MSSELLEFITNHEDAFKSKSRLSSLYADFAPLKSTNPDGYAANISAWRSALSKASSAGVTPGGSPLTLRYGEKLARALERRDFGRPLSLSCVLDEAVASKELLPLQEFMNAKTSVYQKRWMPHVRIPSAWEAAQWALHAAGITSRSSSDKLAEGDFVVMGNVEKAAEAITSSIQQSSATPTSRIYSLSTFRNTFAHILSSTQPLKDTDIRILLTHLTRDKQVAAVHNPSASDGEEIVVKFTTQATPTPPITVTETDRTIASLLTLQQTLQNDIARLNTAISQRETTARTAISSGNKTTALSALRSKKLASTALEKREASLAQVESTLNAIDEAIGNVQMARVMESSAKVLQQLNRESGGAEHVQRVMDDVADAQADVEDVGRILGEEANAGAVDEGEVDEELEAMVAEQKREEDQSKENANDAQEKAGEDGVSLPDVPSAEPVRRKPSAGRNDEEEMEKRLSDMSLDEYPSVVSKSNEQQEQGQTVRQE